MERIANGDTTVNQIRSGQDELYEIHRATQELCMSLSIQRYELDSTMQSYGRFVPQGLTTLLDRAAISEVNLGDSRRVTGCVGLFSVGNRDNARTVLSDHDFVDFVNHSFDLLGESISQHKGYLLSSGLRLSSMEVFFPESTGDGIRAGLSFLGLSRGKCFSTVQYATFAYRQGSDADCCNPLILKIKLSD